MSNREKLIKIDELIKRAKFFGVDFGKGDPKNRLRYYTKIGLLPHALRKSFNGKIVGAYPEWVLKRLVEIDKQLKEGKSIQEIKRKTEKKEAEKEILKLDKERVFQIETQKFLERKIFKTEFLKKFLTKFFSKESRRKILITTSVFVILLSLFFTTKIFLKEISPQKIMANFLAKLTNFNNSKMLAQAEIPETKSEFFPSPSIEPFLTINVEKLTVNAETLINSSLKIKESLTSPILVLQKDERKAILESTELTADRTYTLPDESGIICLSTGNCVSIIGQVLSPGGTTSRLAKFTSPNTIGNSSILDLSPQIALTIDANGNVGIGTQTPQSKLDVLGGSIFRGNAIFRGDTEFYGKIFVDGEIEATGDVCTELQGGKCLSQLITAVFGGGGGVGGSGTSGYFPIFTAPTTIGNSILRQSGSVLYLTGDFEISGLLTATSFKLSTTTQTGYVLTAIDTSGTAAWMPAPTGTLPIGQAGYTLRHDGTSWISNNFLYNTGSFVGIGTTSSLATLAVAGSGYFTGPLTISSSTLPQLILQLGSNQFILELNSNSAKITSPQNLIINSLTGQILATTSIISASSFVSADATVRSSGEYVFREAVPIFKYPLPAETQTTTYVQVSRYFASGETNSQIPTLTSTQRKYAFLINLADNIPQTASSSWRIYRPSAATTYTTFEIQGNAMSSLDEGKPILTSFMDLPANDWQLEVAVPSGSKIRIFNILMLVFDKLP
jgi:DNA-binding transcriptional MerR regulator